MPRFMRLGLLSLGLLALMLGARPQPALADELLVVGISGNCYGGDLTVTGAEYWPEAVLTVFALYKDGSQGSHTGVAVGGKSGTYHFEQTVPNDGRTFNWAVVGYTQTSGDVTCSEAPPPPPEEICGDGIDNDGDGYIDEHCAPPEEVCGDGIDNDGDGYTDEGCAPPPQEVCDGVDNDLDGLTDEGCLPPPVEVWVTFCWHTQEEPPFVLMTTSAEDVLDHYLGPLHYGGLSIIPPFNYDADGDGFAEEYSQRAEDAWVVAQDCVFDKDGPGGYNPPPSPTPFPPTPSVPPTSKPPATTTNVVPQERTTVVALPDTGVGDIDPAFRISLDAALGIVGGLVMVIATLGFGRRQYRSK